MNVNFLNTSQYITVQVQNGLYFCNLLKNSVAKLDSLAPFSNALFKFSLDQKHCTCKNGIKIRIATGGHVRSSRTY